MNFNKFNTLEEVISALKQVNPEDLTKETSSTKEVVDFCTEVMIILGKADNILYSLSTQEMKDFSDMLRSIGCVPYNEAHPSLINNDLEYVGQQMDAKDSIDFPLSAFTQLIDSEPSSFTYGASKLLEGDFEYSWLGTWLKAQGITDPNKHYEEILDSKTPSLGE